MNSFLRKALIWLVPLMFSVSLCAQNTTLTGTLEAPDGSLFNGYLRLALSQQAAASGSGGCGSAGGPAQVLPTVQKVIRIVNGSMTGGTQKVWGADCLTPNGVPYSVIVQDNNGNTLFTDQWLIAGSSFNIGTALSIVSPTISVYPAGWPLTNGPNVNAAGALTNDGAGNLTWNAYMGSIGGTFTGPVLGTYINASINGVYNVERFGAVGNCTVAGSNSGCTHNHAALQAAIDAAYLTRGKLYYPTSLTATGETVYYTEAPLNPKGVSMEGPSGSTAWGAFTVGVRGAPSNDVFNVLDPSSIGYVAPLPTFEIKNLAIIVDDSVDVSGTGGTAPFKYRLPGRTVLDAAITLGSAVLTSSTAIFQQGDVGQNILVYGAGVSAANLSTTIASVQSKTQATLASTASTSVSGAQAYIAIMNLAVTNTIGNCAWAYDAYNSSAGYLSNNLSGAMFDHVTVDTINNDRSNNSCGFFFQGPTGPYQTTWKDSFVQAAYPFAYVGGSGASANISGQAPGMGDYNTWEHDWIQGYTPFIGYGGNDNKIEAVQTYQTYGPHILSGPGVAGQPNMWSIDIPEEESDCAAAGSTVNTRVAGLSHTVKRLSLPDCSGHATFQWDADHSTVQDIIAGGSFNVNISGNNNEMHAPFSNGYPHSLNSTGTGNSYATGGNSNPFGGFQPPTSLGADDVGVTQFASSLGYPAVSRTRKALERSADFLTTTGPSAYYFNKEDLWIWPPDVVGFGTNCTVNADTNSESGTNCQMAANTTFIILGINGIYDYVGKQIPAANTTLYFKVKGSSSFSATFYCDVDALGADTHVANTTASLTTSYQIVSLPCDLTSYAGKTFNPRFQAAGSGNSVTWEWIGVAPPQPPVTNATNATNVSSSTDATNTNRFVCMLATNGTANQPCLVWAGFTMNPSSSQIKFNTSDFELYNQAGSTQTFFVDNNGNATARNNLQVYNGTQYLQIGELGNNNGIITSNQGIVFRGNGGTQNMYYSTNGSLWVGSGNGVYSNPTYLLTVGTGNLYGFDNSGNATLGAVNGTDFQRNGITSYYKVASNFTTAANTNLQTITGLTWTLIANTAQVVPFSCHLSYSQATGTAAVAFGIQSATIAPNNIEATGKQWTAATTDNQGVLTGLASTTATNIVSATPGATATNYAVDLDGTIDNPSNASTNVINIMVSTATSGDAVTVNKGSSCRIN